MDFDVDEAKHNQPDLPSDIDSDSDSESEIEYSDDEYLDDTGTGSADDDKQMRLPLFKESKISAKTAVTTLLDMENRFRPSRAMMAELFVLLSIVLLPQDNCLPTYSAAKRFVRNRYGESVSVFAACPGCGELHQSVVRSIFTCTKCHSELFREPGKPHLSFFKFSILSQLRWMFQRNWVSKCFRYVDGRPISPPDTLRDIWDAPFFVNFCKEAGIYKFARDLVLTFCADGINPFKRWNSASLWVFCLSIDNLPPWLRLKPDMMLLYGITTGHPPNIKPFINGLKDELLLLLQGEAIYDSCAGQPRLSRCLLGGTVCDLPASALVRRGKTAGAYQACSYCWLQGELIDGTVRYTGYRRLLPPTHPWRTDHSFGIPETRPPPSPRCSRCTKRHADIVEAALRDHGVNLSRYFGVNGVSPFSSLPYYNWTWQTLFDVMHLVMRCVQYLLSKVFSNDADEEWQPFTKADRRLLLARARSLRRVLNFGGQPHKILEKPGFAKAHDALNFVLYTGEFIFAGIGGSVGSIIVEFCQVVGALLSQEHSNASVRLRRLRRLLVMLLCRLEKILAVGPLLLLAMFGFERFFAKLTRGSKSMEYPGRSVANSWMLSTQAVRAIEDCIDELPDRFVKERAKNDRFGRATNLKYDNMATSQIRDLTDDPKMKPLSGEDFLHVQQFLVRTVTGLRQLFDTYNADISLSPGDVPTFWGGGYRPRSTLDLDATAIDLLARLRHFKLAEMDIAHFSMMRLHQQELRTQRHEQRRNSRSISSHVQIRWLGDTSRYGRIQQFYQFEFAGVNYKLLKANVFTPTGASHHDFDVINPDAYTPEVFDIACIEGLIMLGKDEVFSLSRQLVLPGCPSLASARLDKSLQLNDALVHGEDDGWPNIAPESISCSYCSQD